MSITTFSVFNVLYMLAGGYIIYNAPFFRYFCTRDTGYVLYYRVLTVGLVLFSVLYIAVKPYSPIDVYETLAGSKFTISTNEFYLVLFVAIIIRAVVAGALWIIFQCKPQLQHQLELKSLAESEFDRFIYQQFEEKRMMLLTLDNMKIYVGFPLLDLKTKNSKWFRMATKFSGHRDKYSKAYLDTDYSQVLGDDNAIRNNPMLISVDRIISVQLFNQETFAKFNKDGTKENTATHDVRTAV